MAPHILLCLATVRNVKIAFYIVYFTKTLVHLLCTVISYTEKHACLNAQARTCMHARGYAYTEALKSLELDFNFLGAFENYHLD